MWITKARKIMTENGIKDFPDLRQWVLTYCDVTEKMVDEADYKTLAEWVGII